MGTGRAVAAGKLEIHVSISQLSLDSIVRLKSSVSELNLGQA